MWGFLWYPVRLFNQAGLSGLWTALIMYLSACAIGLFLMRGHWRELAAYPGKLLGIALASGWCNTAFIVAIAEKDASRVVLLFYLAPVWTIILGMIFLKERPKVSALYVCIFAFIGAMLMLWNPGKGFPWPRDSVDWLAISAGFSFAIMNVLIRDLQRVSIPAKAFISWIGVIIIVCLWMAFKYFLAPINSGVTHSFVPQLAWTVWLACVALGAFGIVSMTLAVQYGVTKIPLYQSSIILLVEVAVTVISEHFLSEDRLSLLAWVGGALIVGASVIFALTIEKSGAKSVVNEKAK